mmetsp:Transcript_6940/g.14327  ORF Transcript_6940/g.14327 Transcript_6940/m.14327 type:complete len:406 (-) Transcript_6940:126-1343(-)
MGRTRGHHGHRHGRLRSQFRSQCRSQFRSQFNGLLGGVLGGVLLGSRPALGLGLWLKSGGSHGTADHRQNVLSRRIQELLALVRYLSPHYRWHGQLKVQSFAAAAAAATTVVGELGLGFAGSVARLNTALTLAATNTMAVATTTTTTATTTTAATTTAANTTLDGNLNGTVRSVARSVVRRYLFDYLSPVSHWLDAMHAQLTYVDFRVDAPDGYWEEVLSLDGRQRRDHVHLVVYEVRYAQLRADWPFLGTFFAVEHVGGFEARGGIKVVVQEPLSGFLPHLLTRFRNDKDLVSTMHLHEPADCLPRALNHRSLQVVSTEHEHTGIFTTAMFATVTAANHVAKIDANHNGLRRLVNCELTVLRLPFCNFFRLACPRPTLPAATSTSISTTTSTSTVPCLQVALVD